MKRFVDLGEPLMTRLMLANFTNPNQGLPPSATRSHTRIAKENE
jgi:hypothetical protein